VKAKTFETRVEPPEDENTVADGGCEGCSADMEETNRRSDVRRRSRTGDGCGLPMSTDSEGTIASFRNEIDPFVFLGGAIATILAIGYIAVRPGVAGEFLTNANEIPLERTRMGIPLGDVSLRCILPVATSRTVG